MLLFLDIETTGFDPLTSELLELSAARFDGEKVIATFDQLVCLESENSEIPPIVQKLTGIKKEMLMEKPALGTIREKFLQEFLKPDDIIVGHNISFDTGFLRGKGFEFENPEIDTYPLATILLPDEQSHSLEIMTEKYNLPHEPAHRALGDALANLELWKLLQNVLTQKFSAEFQEKGRGILRKSEWSGKKFFLDSWENFSTEIPEKPQLSFFETAVPVADQSVPKKLLKLPGEKTEVEKDFQNRVFQVFAEGKKAVWELLMAAPEDSFVLAAEAAVKFAAVKKQKIGICFHAYEGARARLLMEELRSASPELSFTEIQRPESVLCRSKWEKFLAKEVFSDLETILALKVLREESQGRSTVPNLRQEEWAVWQQVSDRFHDQCFESCSGKKALPEEMFAAHDVFFFPHKLLADFPGENLLLSGFESAEEILTLANEQKTSSRRLRAAADCLEESLRERLFFWLDLFSGFLGKNLPENDWQNEIILNANFCAQKDWQEFQESFSEFDREAGDHPEVTPDLRSEIKNWKALFEPLSKNELALCRIFPDGELEFSFSPLNLSEAAAHLFNSKEILLTYGWPFPKNADEEWQFPFTLPENLETSKIFPEADDISRIRILLPEEITEVRHTPTEAAKWLESILKNSSENVLAVFPSQKMVEEVEEKIMTWCEEQGVQLISHRSGSAGKIRHFLARSGQKIFIASPYLLEKVFPLGKSFEFGLVFFYKFLFDSPGNLLVSERKKLFANAFSDYLFPRSLARFEREVYRLLRHQEKPYYFLCFDPRLSDAKGYGHWFRSVFPEKSTLRSIVLEEIPEIFPS